MIAVLIAMQELDAGHRYLLRLAAAVYKCEAGIADLRRRAAVKMSGLAGEIPFAEVFPELWVIQDEDAYQARQVLDEELITQPSNPGDWICTGCGEHHESQFSECWMCGQASA